jgi:hypothetical protein
VGGGRQRLVRLRGSLSSGHCAAFTATHVLAGGGGGGLLLGMTEKYPGPVAVKAFDLRARPAGAPAREWHLPPALNNVTAAADGGGGGADWLCVGSATGQLAALDARAGGVRAVWQAHEGAVTGLLPAAAGGGGGGGRRDGGLDGDALGGGGGGEAVISASVDRLVSPPLAAPSLVPPGALSVGQEVRTCLERSS